MQEILFGQSSSVDLEAFLGYSSCLIVATPLIFSGLGILIGFSWEQSFDTAVDVVAEGCRGGN